MPARAIQFMSRILVVALLASALMVVAAPAAHAAKVETAIRLIEQCKQKEATPARIARQMARLDREFAEGGREQRRAYKKRICTNTWKDGWAKEGLLHVIPEARIIRGCESAHGVRLIGPDGNDWGDFQVRVTVHADLIRSMGYTLQDMLDDPYKNARVAARIYKQAGNTWVPWWICGHAHGLI